MDGTLLNAEKAISKRNFLAIQQAKKEGITVVLASGRPRQGLQQYLDELGLTSKNDFVISYNGSLVECAGSNEVLHQTGLKGTDVKLAFEISQKLGLDIHGFSVERGLITHRHNQWTDIEGKLNGLSVEEVDFNAIDDDEDFIKVMMVSEEQQLTQAIKKIPTSLKEQYTVVRSAAIFLEVLHPDSNKGVAVEKLCQELNISADQVMCVGDAENDHAMLAFAGLSVAMANADDETKAMVDYITKSNLEDGVGIAIEEKALQLIAS